MRKLLSFQGKNSRADALKVRRNTGQQLIMRSVLGARARQGWESTNLIDKRPNGDD